MALSYQEVVSDGNLNTLPLGIEFTSQADITVLYDGAILPFNVETGRNWIWSNENTIRFRNDESNAPIPAGVVIRAERNTNVEQIRHVFSVQAGGGGSAKFTNQTMDENFRQFLYTAQESVERTDEAHAAVEQAILVAEGAVTTANAATATANAATGTANAAISAANSVVSIAADAVTTANSAVLTADAAALVANDAHGIATGVDAKAQQALDDSTDAVNTANTIAGTANTALSTANNAELIASGAADDAALALSTANGIAGTANDALDLAEAADSTATAAAIAAAAAMQKSDNLAGLTDLATARSNLGLGNSSTRDVGTSANTVAAGNDSRITGAAQKAHNLADLANAATARGNLGLSATAVTSLPTLGAPLLTKLDNTAPCLVKTGAGTLTLRAGTSVLVGDAYRVFSTATVVTMPTLTGGEDYSVWVGATGAPYAVNDPYEAPANEANAVKIGGFHYGLVAPGTTLVGGSFATSGPGFIWTQPDVDLLAGINAYSIWDLGWRCLGEQRGMTLEPNTKLWHAIYFGSPDTDTYGISRNGRPVASGTVLPKVPKAYGGDGTTTYSRLSYYEALEIVSSHGLLLYDYTAACTGFFGVTENQSLGGGSVTIPQGGRQPGYTSRIGVEQATGHLWVIGGPAHSVGGSAWQAGPGRGSFYGSTGLPLFGGARTDAAHSGSRAAHFGSVPWNSDWVLAVRAVGCHFQFD